MPVFGLLAVIAVAGAIGGVFAALLSEDKGFWKPTKVENASGTIYRPGFLGLIAVGAAAAALSFALYGPLASQTVVGGPDAAHDATAGETGDDFGVTLAALGGAVLVGMGGSKWLSTQVDSKLLRETASAAAASDSNDSAASAIAAAGPVRALQIAQDM